MEICDKVVVIYLHLCTFKTPIIDAKNKQKVIADFTPQHTYLPI